MQESESNSDFGSGYSPEESQKITATLGRIKEIYKDVNNKEKDYIFKIFAEILEDPYYKENMTYYFKKFLTEKY